MPIHASRFKNKIIWVTGASSGLGLGLSRGFLKEGAILVASARRVAPLLELQNDFPGHVHVLPLDVTDSKATHRVVQDIMTKLGRIDIAVLNAGGNAFGDPDQFESSQYDALLKLNFLSVVYGIEALLPYMRSTPNAQIVAMSSVAGYGGLPQAGPYCAAKAAVRVMVESLQVDPHWESVSFSVICPGFVKTPLTDKNTFRMPFIMSVEKAVGIMLDGIYKRKLEISYPKRLVLPLKMILGLPACLRSVVMKIGNRKARS